MFLLLIVIRGENIVAYSSLFSFSYVHVNLSVCPSVCPSDLFVCFSFCVCRSLCFPDCSGLLEHYRNTRRRIFRKSPSVIGHYTGNNSEYFEGRFIPLYGHRTFWSIRGEWVGGDLCLFATIQENASTNFRIFRIARTWYIRGTIGNIMGTVRIIICL